MIISAVIAIVLSCVAVRFMLKKQIKFTSKVTRLVVLPFDNLGSIEDKYFAIPAYINGRLDISVAKLLFNTVKRLALLSKQAGEDVLDVGKVTVYATV